MTTDKSGESNRELTAAEGLALLRDGAATGQLYEFEKVVFQLVGRPGLWGKFWQWFAIKSAICGNYDRIINVCDQVLGSPSSSEADRKYFQEKKDEANEGKKSQGCWGTINVS